MIQLSLYNKLWIRVDGDITALNLIKESFSYYVENYFYMDSYKSGNWDGKIKIFDFKNRLLPYGLLFDLIKLLKKNNYEISATEEVKNLFGLDQYENLVLNYDLNIQPRYYQDDIIKECIKHKCGIFVSPTASGKTPIIAYINKILLENELINKSLIIVPTTSLVLQFYDDLIEYGIDSNLVGKFYADEKDWEKPILISTWQSLSYDNEKIRQNEVADISKKLKKKSISSDKKAELKERYEKITSQEYIENVRELTKYRKDLMSSVDCVIVDECQTVKSQSLSELMKDINNAVYRFGCTGTLPNSKLDVINIKSYLGPVLKHYTVEELTNAGYLNKCTINVYNLYYSKRIDGTLNEVKDYVFHSEFRLNLMKNIISSIDDNILILVGRIEKEGKVLENYLKEHFPDKKVKFLYGNIKGDIREKWRQKCINERDVIIIAMYPLFQQGINIPNLSTVIFGSSYRAKIRTLQSIGRSLRKAEGKGESQIIDIVDYSNKYLPKHAKERLDYYKSEGFEINQLTYKESKFNNE